MKIKKQARREGKELFRACLVDGLLDEDRAREAVADLLARKPRGYLAILTYFQQLVRLHIESRTARIESPVPLDDLQKSAIADQVSSRYGKGLIFSFAQNPQLIGGLKVRVGSDVIDGSIRGRLAALEQGFN